MAGARRVAVPALIVAAAVCLLVGQLSLYADRAIFDSRGFADRATSSLSNPAVRAGIAARVTDEVVELAPDAIAVRPLISGVVDGVVGSAPFQGVFREAVYDLHRSVFKRDRATVTLTLADVGTLVIDALERISPPLARRVPGDLRANLLKVSREGAGVIPVDLARIAAGVAWLTIGALVLALALFAAAIALSRRRRRTLTRCGLAIAATGAVGLVLYELLLTLGVTLAVPPAERAAARGALSAFLGDLGTWNVGLAAAGVVVAAAASALIKPIDLSDGFERVRAVVTRTPATPWRRVLRAVGLIALGALVIVADEVVVELAAIVLGLAVLWVGVAEVLRMTLPARVLSGAPEPPTAAPRREALRIVLAGAFVAILLVGFVSMALSHHRADPPLVATDACNGHRELCDRRLDRIALAASHNSMSAASEPGWLFAGHTYGIRRQLEDGVRALLIDTHYGFETPRGVATDLRNDPKSRAKIADEFGEEFVETAERLRERIGYRGGGPREVFLCHAYCELGATRAERALAEIREFLIAHPHEVLVISVEDGISAADTARTFEDSGLLDMVWRGPLDPMPTPRQMIERGQRVIVFGETADGSVPWYHPQFEGLVEETGYGFDTLAELEQAGSCAPNRGLPDSPLLLLNHWIETTPAPRPTNADRANARAVLLERARRCQRRRDQLANLVAVDFADRGDLIEVVEELNGVR